MITNVMHTYADLLRDRAFMGYVLTGGMAMAGMFAYIVGSPYVFMEHFHVTTARFGVVFGVNALGLVLAAQLNARLVRRFSSDAIIRKVLVIQVSAGFLLFAGTWWGFLGLYGVAALLFVYVSSVGCLFPNITAMAMAPQGARAGSASALIGVIQFVLAAVSASLIGAANSGAAVPMAVVIGICSVLAVIVYRVMVYGVRAPAASRATAR
jgi:DHA1 family bicyclomycin/chloramphenicol resistance-like MFS transporter